MGKFRQYHQKIRLGIETCAEAGITGIETHTYVQAGNCNDSLGLCNLGDRYNLVKNGKVFSSVDGKGFPRLPIQWEDFSGKYRPSCGLTPGGFLQACQTLVAMGKQSVSAQSTESAAPATMKTVAKKTTAKKVA